MYTFQPSGEKYFNQTFLIFFDNTTLKRDIIMCTEIYHCLIGVALKHLILIYFPSIIRTDKFILLSCWCVCHRLTTFERTDRL
jgi:hypothetical protein